MSAPEPHCFDMATGDPVAMTDPATHTPERAVADFEERAKAIGLCVRVRLLDSESGIRVEVDYGGATGATDATFADVFELENAFSEVLDGNY